jgi:hypothetical protein
MTIAEIAAALPQYHVSIDRIDLGVGRHQDVLSIDYIEDGQTKFGADIQVGLAEFEMPIGDYMALALAPALAVLERRRARE